MLSAIHGEFSHYVVGCDTVNYVFFCPPFHSEFSQYVVWRFTVNFLALLSHVELSRSLVRLLSVNLLDVLSQQRDMFEYL